MNQIEPDRLVFVDESGATTEMTRRYGRAPCGERIREATPAGHWSTLTLLGAMNREGMVASMTVDSPTDGDVFLAYLDQVLCPALRPGQVVVMDNLSAHKIEKVPSGLKRREPHCSICRPTSPTSIRSKKLLKRIFTEGIRKTFKFYKEFGDIWKPMRCRRS